MACTYCALTVPIIKHVVQILERICVLILNCYLAGTNSSYFSLEINHAGFFVGNGSERAYLDGHII